MNTCTHPRRTRPDRDGYAWCWVCLNSFYTLTPIGIPDDTRRGPRLVKQKPTISGVRKILEAGGLV